MPNHNRFAYNVTFYFEGTRRLDFQVEDMPLMALTDSKPIIKGVIQSALSIRGEMHLYRLNQRLNGRVKKVETHYKAETAQNLLRVIFENGYEIMWDEEDIESDAFRASCIMLYDLPYKDE